MMEGASVVTLVVGVANLVAVGLAILKGGIWAGQVTATLKSHGRELTGMKATLGNGEPGTVVRVPVCQALHAGITAQITAVHEDIRTLQDEVRSLKDE